MAGTVNSPQVIYVTGKSYRRRDASSTFAKKLAYFTSLQPDEMELAICRVIYQRKFKGISGFVVAC